MLRTKGFSAIAVVVASFAARANAMESHRTTEKAWQEYVRGGATRMQERRCRNKLIHLMPFQAIKAACWKSDANVSTYDHSQ